MDIDGIISPKELTVAKVLKYIRKGDISDIYELQAGKAEIIEFQVKESSRLVGYTIKRHKLTRKYYNWFNSKRKYCNNSNWRHSN